MKKLWTVQSEYTLNKIIDDGIYYPNFNTSLKFAQRRKNSYRYILNEFNQRNKTEYNGLIFCISEFENKTIKNYEEYKIMVYMSGAGGISNSKDDYYLLELEVDDSIDLCSCQFYIFCDLIAYLDDTEDYNITEQDIENVKSNLFIEDSCTNLVQSHLGYIDKNMIRNVYRSYHGRLKMHMVYEPVFGLYGPPKLDEQYGECSKIEYYKTHLINKNNK